MPIALAICSKFPCAYVAIGVQGFGLSRAFSKLGLVAFLLHPISWCHCRAEVSLEGAMQRFEFSRWRRHSTNFDIRGATAHDVMTLGIH
jgi:hypothetical protein